MFTNSKPGLICENHNKQAKWQSKLYSPVISRSASSIAGTWPWKLKLTSASKDTQPKSKNQCWSQMPPESSKSDLSTSGTLCGAWSASWILSRCRKGLFRQGRHAVWRRPTIQLYHAKVKIAYPRLDFDCLVADEIRSRHATNQSKLTCHSSSTSHWSMKQTGERLSPHTLNTFVVPHRVSCSKLVRSWWLHIHIYVENAISSFSQCSFDEYAHDAK